MRYLRWGLLSFHVLLIAALNVVPVWLVWSNWNERLTWLGLACLNVALQIAFVFAPGPLMRLTRVPARRVIVPALAAGLMLAILVAGAAVALREFFQWNAPGPAEIWWAAVALVWILCSALLFVYSLGLDRIALVRRLFTTVAAADAVQLLAVIPTHIVVSRRPQCMAGYWTGLGLFGGLYVLTWVLGPGILLLFLLETRRRMVGHCSHCGYNLTGNVSGICPECGTPCKEAAGQPTCSADAATRRP